MKTSSKQEEYMRWVFFWIFLALFILIVFGTLATLFLGFGQLTETEREVLFYAFLVEIGAAVLALFYSVFGIKSKHDRHESKVRLALGEYEDVAKLLNKNAELSPFELNGESLGDLHTKILNDQGPYLPLDLPSSTHSVFIHVPIGEKAYSGSFVVGTYLVDMTEDED